MDSAKTAFSMRPSGNGGILGESCPNEIAPEMLARLLPDGGIIELPQLSHVNGGYTYRAIKRAFDLATSMLALVVLSLPMVVAALIIRSESTGSAIYSQMRVGKGGKLFKIYKFRTMYANAETGGAKWAADDDPRVTPFGRKLRNSRMDEIPQFWNVVKGDMSLVGPRPERPVFHEVFEERIHGWGQRLAVRQGITGLAQVEGGYDLLPKEKARIDIEYIENRSLLLDLGIMLRTLGVVRTGEGAR